MALSSSETPHRFRMGSGLRVLVVRRPASPVVAVLMLYGAGSARDPEGLSGLAHLSEHMMFRGSARFPDGSVDEITNRQGGANNAMTTNDYVAYYFVFPKAGWRVALDIEADRMLSCSLEPAAFETERSVTVEERQMLDDEPESLLDEALQLLAYRSHPYRLPVAGLLPDLERVTLMDLREFYETWYTPDNAVMVVAGDVEPPRVEELVRETMEGGRTGPSARARLADPPPEPVQTSPRHVRLERDSGIPRLSVAFHCPAALHADSPALDLVATILGTGRSSRLYRRLVAESDDVNDVAVDRMLQKCPGILTVTAELSEGGDLGACEDRILREVVELGRAGPEPGELEKAKLLWRLDRLLGRESTLGLAGQLAFWEIMDRWESGREHEDSVMAVTGDDVARAAREYLDPGVRSSVWMLPANP